MKISLNRVLVVEGKEDASYLSNYIDSEIVVVNGFELKEATISYLKDKPVILLFDPDEAGLRIRKKARTLLKDTVDVEIDINKCNRGIKNGVAECEIDEILTKLRPFCVNKVANVANISKSDLYNLGLTNNKELRVFVCEKLNLGECNLKTLHKRLINNNISLDKLCEIIKEYKNGN